MFGMKLVRRQGQGDVEVEEEEEEESSDDDTIFFSSRASHG